MQVKATSPLTHNISGTAKAAAQVKWCFCNQIVSCKFDIRQSLLAFYLWQNDYTFNGLLGNIISQCMNHCKYHSTFQALLWCFSDLECIRL